MNKKGFFFTIGLTFIALLLFSFSLVVSNHLSTYDERFIEMTVFNRLNDLDNSLQKSIKETFEKKSGIILGKTNNKVTFQQSLPLNFTEFNSSMNNLKSFVEYDQNIILNISDISSRIPLTIYPYNIEYFQNFDDNSIEILTNHSNSKSYSITIDAGETINLSSCTDSTSSGSLNFSVKIIDSTGVFCSVSTNIDPSQTNEITANDISVETTNGPGIKISTTSTEVKINTIIDLIDNNDEATIIKFPDNTISIDLKKLELSKIGPSILA